MLLGKGLYGDVRAEGGHAVKTLPPRCNEYLRNCDLIPRSTLKEMVAYRALEGVPNVSQLLLAEKDSEQRLRLHTELADGDLSSLASRTLDPASVLRQLCAGLAGMHARGILHNDIKPDNILFRGQQVYFTDFGMVGFTVGEGAVGRGCVGFEPPEQRETALATRASDVFSLAVTFVCWLAGENAPKAAPSDLLRRSGAATLQVRHIFPDLQTSLEPVLNAMLQTDATLRPSARECYTLVSGDGTAPLCVECRRESKPSVRAVSLVSKASWQLCNYVPLLEEKNVDAFLEHGAELLDRACDEPTEAHAMACVGLLLKMFLNRTISSNTLSGATNRRVTAGDVVAAERYLLEALDYRLHLW